MSYKQAQFRLKIVCSGFAMLFILAMATGGDLGIPLQTSKHFEVRIPSRVIGLYRENVIAIKSEAGDSLTYYRRKDQSGFARVESSLHCDVGPTCRC